MQIVIIDYGAGNLRSVARAVEHVVSDKAKVQVTDDPSALQSATHIIMPGVGAFGDCMQGISRIKGMVEALHEQVIVQKTLFLGICVGMQMLFEKGMEHGEHVGLGWLKGNIVPIQPKDASFKIPHMGWNELELHATHPLLNGIKNGDHAYFVHSYYADCGDETNLLASVNYGQKLAAVVGQGNIMGTQFHPEKSQDIGLMLLKNFIAMHAGTITCE